MMLIQLVDFIAPRIDRTVSVVRERAETLRTAGLIVKGKQGPGRGARMGNTDATNLLLASVTDHKRGDNIAANVLRMRNAPLSAAIYSPRNDSLSTNLADVAYFTRGLAFAAVPTCGAALDAILDDLRSGAFARWSEGVPYGTGFEIHDTGYVQIFLRRPHFNKAVVYGYEHSDAPKEKRAVTRVTRIDGQLLEKLAEALGPPT